MGTTRRARGQRVEGFDLGFMTHLTTIHIYVSCMQGGELILKQTTRLSRGIDSTMLLCFNIQLSTYYFATLSHILSQTPP